MMTRKIHAAAIVALMTSAASAADLPRGAAPYYSAPSQLSYNWAGAYVGVNAGYQWGKTTRNPTSPSGIAGGLQAGYNWQTGNFVFGAETDIQISDADDTFAAVKFSNPWFGTLRGRAGYALNNILFYGTFGLAYGDVTAELGPVSQTHTLVGYALGAGMEVGLTPNWSARAEYLYIDLSNDNYAITGTRNGLESNLLRFGVNYRF